MHLIEKDTIISHYIIDVFHSHKALSMKLIVLVFMSLVSLGGCDIPGYLDVKNCTKSNTYYLTYSILPEGIKDTVILEIPSNDT
mgnify:CR=1 FL=1